MPTTITTADKGIADQILLGPVSRIRDQIATAVADERERCAKICDMRAKLFALEGGECGLSLQEECEDLAHAIRRDPGWI